MKIVTILFLLTNYSALQAQNSFKAILKSIKTNEPITNVSVYNINSRITVSSDENGLVIIENIGNG